MNQINWMEKYMKEAEHLIYNQQVDEGLLALNSLLYDEPGYSRLHNHIAWAYLYYTSDWAQAELHLNMAIRFDEGFAPPYLHMGVLYNRQGRYSEAITFLQTGLTKADANRVALLENIAQAYELKKEYAQAIRYYKEAMASTVGTEMAQLDEGIKRCRRKRWVLLFG